VYPDGAVVMTAPQWFSLRAIEMFFAKHSAWVREKVAAASGRTVIRIPRKDISLLKKQTLALAERECERHAAFFGVSFNKISIRAQRTRWGSCSLSGNLSFNYRIAALPQHLVEYIIVHEVCHLLELNHSKRFWQHVARAIPEHKALRKELRNIVMTFY
jgi:predicted metal-dependent hydrolase